LALRRYGDRVGLVFQLVDDLLDQDGAARLQGKEKVRQRAARLTGRRWPPSARWASGPSR
jgi:hypothetical protein